MTLTHALCRGVGGYSRFAFNSEEMLRYMWLDSIVDNNAQKMTLSVGQPAVTKLA